MNIKELLISFSQRPPRIYLQLNMLSLMLVATGENTPQSSILLREYQWIYRTWLSVRCLRERLRKFKKTG
jgi:hypothetical protein